MTVDDFGRIWTVSGREAIREDGTGKDPVTGTGWDRRFQPFHAARYHGTFRKRKNKTPINLHYWVHNQGGATPIWRMELIGCGCFVPGCSCIPHPLAYDTHPTQMVLYTVNTTHTTRLLQQVNKVTGLSGLD